MAGNSIDLIHTSIPFSNHYEYTPSYNDFGHNQDNDRFFEQMDYLTPELPEDIKARSGSSHSCQGPYSVGNTTGTGMPTVDPFSDMTVFHFIKHGFQYMGRITVVTDVVREKITRLTAWDGLSNARMAQRWGCWMPGIYSVVPQIAQRY